jgi:hypothetical protein
MNQVEWTRHLIDQVAPGAEFPGVENTWWWNPINKRSLRLTHTGSMWIKKHTKFTLHRVDIQDRIMPTQMLQLERLLTEPYYFSDKFILVMSDQDAVMLQLHGGNLAQYLDNLQQNQ